MGYNTVATLWVYPHSLSRCCLPKSRNHAKFRQNLTLQQFKVIDLGVKRICDFLLVINSLIVTLAVSATVFEILTLKARK